ncbi:MAG: hypothetical protein AVDCRST_MAG13-1180 [uncultured Solirubrobacteraceae bacterium]|uniref:Uncharacterized protein n=1 Tax=uncultured Solirubrobacteraceae bacterium TaxID=1162706 RepID=A0A6J4RST1_9ACTN|nr:MAG: hypothetical protein AVDCRST_MAG13-1180 [uncultured Solirubrobacteraceae bacterium]
MGGCAAHARLRALRRHHPPPRRGGPDPHRPLGRRDGPARLGGPAPRAVLPGLPQLPRGVHRPRRAPDEPHRARPGRPGRVLRHPPGRVRPRAHGGVGGAARRPGREDRGKIEPGPPRAHRPRHRGVRRSGVQGDADARDHEPHPGAHRPVAGQADRPAELHDARPAGRAPVRASRPGLALRRPGRRHGVALRRGARRLARRIGSRHARAAAGRRGGGRGVVPGAVLHRRRAAGDLGDRARRLRAVAPGLPGGERRPRDHGRLGAARARDRRRVHPLRVRAAARRELLFALQTPRPLERPIR